MPKRVMCQLGDQQFIVLPYENFAAMGAPVFNTPLVAVRLFDRIEDALTPTIELARAHEDALPLGALAVLRERLGMSAPSAERERSLYETKVFFPWVFFRGESREEHGLMPTLYRFRTSAELQRSDRAVHLRRRLEKRRARLMQVGLALKTWRLSAYEQARAAARHYGSTSSFLDFSFDPRVAAYFAHPPFHDHERAQSPKTPVGIIYALGYELFQQRSHVQGWKLLKGGGIQITFYSTMRQWKLSYLGFDPVQRSIGER